MYKIIGADQKEYGPVTGDQLRQWIAEGRMNAETRVRAEGSETWQPLSAFPEFAGIAGAGAAASPPPLSGETVAVPIENILARDYDLGIGDCIGKGWNLVKNKFGLLFCGALIYFAVEFGIALLGAIPFIGALFSLANLFVVGPLLGGVYYINLQAIRNQPASPGDVFVGFRTAFVQLFLGNFIQGLLAGLCLIPAVIVAIITIFPLAIHHQSPTPANLLPFLAAALVCMIPAVFLSVNWIFTLPLILDRKMGFWPAMQTSWEVVGKHWWRVFGFLVLVVLINIGGLCVCCVGLLFTAPIGLAAMMYAYETLFGAGRTQAI